MYSFHKKYKKISKCRDKNKNKIKTQKGGTKQVINNSIIYLESRLGAYPSIKNLFAKIFEGKNESYFKMDGSMPDPFIKKIPQNPKLSSNFYLKWYKEKIQI
jgi:hypothetical protein